MRHYFLLCLNSYFMHVILILYIFFPVIIYNYISLILGLYIKFHLL